LVKKNRNVGTVYALEVKILRSVKGSTRLDKIKNKDVWKELNFYSVVQFVVFWVYVQQPRKL